MTNDQFVKAAYRRYGRSGVGNDVNQIDREGLAYWTAQLATGAIKPEDFNVVFDAAVRQYWEDHPNSISTFYTMAMAPGGGQYAEFAAKLRERGLLK